MEKYKLLEYNEENYDKVIAFMQKCLPESGRSFALDSKHKAYQNISDNFLKFWCMFDGEKLIGTVAVRPLKEKQCELKSLYLYEEYQGLGLGYRMFRLAIDAAKQAGFEEMYLDTISSSSKRAIHLYEHAGFTHTERYNDNPVTDVFMRLNLLDREERL